MSASKTSEIVRDSQRNMTEFTDFVSGMKNWKAEMSEKDAGLRSSNKSNTNSAVLPPVRGKRTKTNGTAADANCDWIKKKKQKETKPDSQTPKQDPPPSAQKIKAYDYAAWDKFDVDKACEDIDKEEEAAKEGDECDDQSESSSESSLSDDEDRARAQAKEKALIEKNKGNDLFKSGMFDEAIECYTKGLNFDPLNCVLYANRALVYVKKLMWKEAEEDCTSSIALDKKYIKAHQRRAWARKALGKLNEAREDCLRVLKLEPGNKEAIKELHVIDKLVRQRKTPPTSKIEEIGLTAAAPSSIKPTDKPSANEEDKQESKSLLEIDSDQVEESAPGEIIMPMRRMTITEVDDSPPPARTTRTEVEPPPPTRDEVIRSVDSIKTQFFNSKGPKLMNELPLVHSSSQSEKRTLPATPRTCYQLQADWRKLSSQPELRYEYVKSIPLSAYASLFGHSMEPDIFTGFIKVFSNFYIRDNLDLVGPLTALSNVNRFYTMISLVGPEETRDLQRLFDVLRSQGDTEVVETLRQKYHANC